MNMGGPLLVVSDIERSKEFYAKALGQTVISDYGANVTFDGGFSLQTGFAELAGFDPALIVQKSHSFELYFEAADFDECTARFDAMQVEYLGGGVREYSWGQRVVRFYDPDGHIIEVGEPMDFVAKRFLRQGLSVEETARITQYSAEIVEKIKSEL